MCCVRAFTTREKKKLYIFTNRCALDIQNRSWMKNVCFFKRANELGTEHAVGVDRCLRKLLIYLYVVKILKNY